MDRITRKSLKDDRFAAEVTQSVEYIARHRRQTLIYAGAAVGVLALLLGIFFYRQHRKTAVHTALYKALETYHALVTQEDRPGRITFKTVEEKNSKALGEFEALARNYSGTTEARIAQYYVGLIQFELGKPAEAQKTLEEVIRHGNDNVLSLARLALADVYAAQGKDEDARKIYDYLVKNPTDTVSEARAQLALARFLHSRKPEEAKKILEDLVKQPGSVSAAAGGLLRELGGS